MNNLRLLAVVLPALLLAACKPAADTSPAPPGTATPPAPVVESAPPPMSATSPFDSNAPLSAQVTLQPTTGNTANGALVITVQNGDLLVTGRLSGLGANAQHGFHIHENGDCSAPDATSAGAHFNPAAQPHGAMGSAAHHAGDIPNQVADGNGEASVNVVLAGLELGSGSAIDILGRSVIVHAQPDDYTTQPTGNAGARIACGVIMRVP